MLGNFIFPIDVFSSLLLWDDLLDPLTIFSNIINFSIKLVHPKFINDITRLSIIRSQGGCKEWNLMPIKGFKQPLFLKV